MEHKAVGRRARALRKKAGLTLVELAGKAGISQGQLSRLENGQQSFRSAILLRLADGMGVRPVEFFIASSSSRRCWRGPMTSFTTSSAPLPTSRRRS